MEPGGNYFHDNLSFCRSLQTAFGLRLRGRIRVGASCFDTLGVHVCEHEKWLPQCGFRKKVGGRGGTQLIDFKNKALVYWNLEPLLPLRYGGFYRQPGGSSLRPAAGFRKVPDSEGT